MNLLYLAYRNLVSKPLNLLLSLLLLVLSVSLVTFILQLTEQMNQQMDKNIAPFDMVVGAKGSPLQLVLSSVLHIDNPTGNIKLQEALEIMKHPFVDKAIPVSYGDNYKGYRILGSEPSFQDRYNAVIDEGRNYQNSFELVAGSAVIDKLGLKLNDEVVGSHGLAAGGEAHDDHPYTVVGILKPTGTVIDQLLLCNLESVWDAHDHEHDEEEHDHEGHDHEEHQHEDGEHDHDHEGHDHKEHHHEDGEHNHEGHDHKEHHHEDGEHDHEGHDHEEHHHEDGEHDHDGHDHEEHHHEDGEHDHEDHDHEEHPHEDGEDDHEHADDREITSLLIKFKNPMALVQMPRFINENTNMQAALPGFEVQRLMGLLGAGVKTINGIAFAILFVSGLSIFISLLKTIRERRQELALLRTYGMGTSKLLLLVLFEGLFLAFVGFLIGWLLGRLALVLASGYIEAEYGYVLQLNGPNFVEVMLLGVTMLIAIIAVILASTSIFKLNISKTLSDV